jgi:hypothetical protein
VWVKQRRPAAPGSIAEALDMFAAEVRFCREIAPVVEVRVPACRSAAADESGTRLELEDLSTWRRGADPVAAARLLRGMHDRWAGSALVRWPWLRRPGAAVELIDALYAERWRALAERKDLAGSVRRLGEGLLGRVQWAIDRAAVAGPITLVHGDAALRNMRTAADGTIALLDWEDVAAGPGVGDLAWLVVSSVPPGQWHDVVAAYGSADLEAALPAAAIQGLLSRADTPVGSPEAAGWLDRLGSIAV